MRVSCCPIVTEQLILEPLAVRHAEHLFPGLHSKELYKYTDEEAPADLDALRLRYARLELRSSPDGSETWLNWAVYSTPEQRYVGYVQATVLSDRTSEVAYVMLQDA